MKEPQSPDTTSDSPSGLHHLLLVMLIPSLTAIAGYLVGVYQPFTLWAAFAVVVMGWMIMEITLFWYRFGCYGHPIRARLFMQMQVYLPMGVGWWLMGFLYTQLDGVITTIIWYVAALAALTVTLAASLYVSFVVSK